QCIAITMGTRALTQESKQGLTWLGTEFWCAAGMPFGIEAGLALVSQRISPATDRARGRLHVASDFAHFPAVLQESHRHPTTDFQLLLGAFGSHRDSYRHTRSVPLALSKISRGPSMHFRRHMIRHLTHGSIMFASLSPFNPSEAGGERVPATV